MDVEYILRISFNEVMSLLVFLASRQKCQALPTILQNLEIISEILSGRRPPEVSDPMLESAEIESNSEIESSDDEGEGAEFEGKDYPVDGYVSESQCWYCCLGTPPTTNNNHRRSKSKNRPKPNAYTGSRKLFCCLRRSSSRDSNYQVHPDDTNVVEKPQVPIDELQNHHAHNCMCGCRQKVELRG